MGSYIESGIYIKENDWSAFYPKLKKSYLRKVKISNIFNLDVKSVIITSTPNGFFKI